jgi:hypothetical protein
MALKIVGRSPRVSEHRIGAADAKHATMQCSACKKNCFVTFPFGGTVEARQAVMRAALDEHRRVCTAGRAEDRRTYEIQYGRA